MTTPSTCPSCGAAVAAELRADGLCAACLLDRALMDEWESDADVSSTDLASGSLFGDLRIVRLLGKGGMASVYEAYDARLDRSVAVKVLPPQFLHDETFARRFEQEARLVARLAHPRIVPVYASGIEQGIPWMTMRLLGGGSVEQLLHGKPLDRPLALELLADIASALDHAHAAGVIHRDIKPTNILLDDDGRASLSDFGLARMLIGGRALTRIGSIAGTPQYMSPEQALGVDIDHRSDIYSLGVVAHELFTGHVPFDDGAPLAVLLKHVNAPVPAPKDGLLTPALMAAVGKALAKRPADRWSSATEFVGSLRRALDADERPASADRRRKIAGGLVWIGSASAALLFFFVTDIRHDGPPATSAPSVEEGHAVGTAPEPAPIVPAAAKAVPIVAGGTTIERVQRASPSGDVFGQAPAVSSSLVERGAVIPESDRIPAPDPGAPLSSPSPSVEELPAAVREVSTVPESQDGDRVVEPVRVRSETPPYPPLARAADIEGDVSLMAQVGADGTVTAVEVLQAPHRLLADAARKAVLRYRYTPGLRNGVPAPFSVRVTIRFRLQ